MLVVKNGKVCAMLFDNVRGKWVYISLAKWSAMTSEKKARYSGAGETV